MLNPDEIKIEVHDTAKRCDLEQMKSYLKNEWCECGKNSEFLCYPDDGECTCGIEKHHIHCKTCGGVSQIG